MSKSIYALCMIMIIISFLGFLVENIWLAFTKGFMDNRGMYLPFLLGYGLAVDAIFCVFGTPDRIWFFGKILDIQNEMTRKIIYFFIVTACICVGEMLLGLFVEKVCHFSWWNYTRIPLHITQYTSIPTSMAFALLITIFMDIFFEPLFNTFYHLNSKLSVCCGMVLFVALLVDFVYNGIKMYQNHGIIKRWNINTVKMKSRR